MLSNLFKITPPIKPSKRLLSVFLALFLFILLPITGSSIINAEENRTETSAGNLYVSDETVRIEEEVTGDVILTGSEVFINSNVGDNVVAAGGEITLEGNSAGNAILAAGAIQIDGDVSGDVFATAGVIIINGNVTGDVRAAAGQIIVNAESIGGDLFLAASEIEVIEGIQVGGDKELAGETIVEVGNGETTDLNQTSGYNYQFEFDEQAGEQISNALNTFFFIIKFITSFTLWIGSVIVAILVLKLFPEFAIKNLETMKSEAGKSIGFGLLINLLTPVALILIALTVIGLPVSWFGLLGLLLIKIIGSVYSYYFIGYFILKKINKDSEPNQILTILVAYTIIGLPLFLISLIPFVGQLTVSLINLVLVSWGVGAMVVNYRR